MSRRLQAVVLFAIVSLIANLQCYAACFSSALNQRLTRKLATTCLTRGSAIPVAATGILMPRL